MSTTETHRRPANHSTRLVSRYLTSDRDMREEVRAAAQEVYSGVRMPSRVMDPYGWRIFNAGEAVRDYVENMARGEVDGPGADCAPLVRDLAGQALADVNWREIAEGLLEDHEAGSSSLAFLACSLLALVPVSLVVVFVARVAGAVAGVMA